MFGSVTMSMEGKQRKKKKQQHARENDKETEPNSIRKTNGHGEKAAYKAAKLATPSKMAAVISSTPSTANKSSDGKKNKSGPFRIKVGCVVALRHRPEGNNVTVKEPGKAARSVLLEDYMSVWTNPVTGRDDGLALIGKRIRCHIPKIEKDQKHTILEGEVIALPDYQADCASSSRKMSMKVELLVDRKMHEAFSFIKRVDEDVDVPSLSEKARRNYKLEQKIRGSNKVVVKIPKLALPAFMDSSTNCVRWSIQKRVPSRLFHQGAARKDNGSDGAKSMLSLSQNYSATGSHSDNSVSNANANGKVSTNNSSSKTDANSSVNTPSSKKRKRSAMSSSSSKAAIKHVGDANDPDERQVSNWRWLTSRYNDYLLYWNHAECNTLSEEVLSCGLVGRVLSTDTSVSTSTTSNSLATVSIERLFLPEQTATGGQKWHQSSGFFTDYDQKQADTMGGDNQISLPSETASKASTTIIEVPVEELIVLSPDVQMLERGSSACTGLEGTCISHSYSLCDDLYYNLQSEPADSKDSMKFCHRCHRELSSHNADFSECNSDECPLAKSGIDSATRWCHACAKMERSDNGSISADSLPCCRRYCDCRDCRECMGSDLHQRMSNAVDAARQGVKKNPRDQLSQLLEVLNVCSEVDFGLPCPFIDINTLPKPLDRPSQKSKAKSILHMKGRPGRKPGKSMMNGDDKHTREKLQQQQQTGEVEYDDMSVFRDTCSRLEQYTKEGNTKKSTSTTNSQTYKEVARNRRPQHTELLTENDKEEKGSGRAARASQRRMMKDVFAIGVVGLGVDHLAKREPQLRFDRSSIHAWGVFADEDIQKGEMVIEYRGEIIGNAVAEKREKLYEAANIGSDYMFRIDSTTVCDATKLGNVARFINASCGPNCRTKIISIDGVKRIAIYAKRDIQMGEELCYDYKFPLEYDESKRIPCHCGSRDCRGYMNWVCIVWSGLVTAVDLSVTVTAVNRC
jgi:SET domain